MGYLSSYSHAGTYYTLSAIPSIDADGLWAHSGVLFSKHGNLRYTIVHLVNKTPGAAPTRSFKIAFGSVFEVENLYLYVSAESGRA